MANTDVHAYTWKAFGWCRLALEDGLDLSDSSDEVNRPNEENDMYVPRSLINTARFTGFEAFLTRGQGRTGGPDTVFRAQPSHAGIVSNG
jgi:hypothetical protein